MYLHTLPAEAQTNSQHSRNQQEGAHDQWRLKGLWNTMFLPSTGLLLTLLRVGVSSAPTAHPKPATGCSTGMSQDTLVASFPPILVLIKFSYKQMQNFCSLYTLPWHPHLVEEARSSMRNGTPEIQLKDNNKSCSAEPEEGPSQDSAERSCQTQVEGNRFLPFPELLPVTQQECWKEGFGFSASFMPIVWVTYTLLKWINHSATICNKGGLKRKSSNSKNIQ